MSKTCIRVFGCRTQLLPPSLPLSCSSQAHLSSFLYKNSHPRKQIHRKISHQPTMASTSTPSYSTPIKTIVVLVQENRSFDNMLGWMMALNPEIDGVNGTESNPLSTSDPESGRIYFGNQSAYVNPDPGHSFQAIYEEVFGVAWTEENSKEKLIPTMEGFAQNAEELETGMSATVMNGFTPDAVPVYKELVSEFAVCDKWFSSNPASTQPNRLFVHSGTSHGLISNDTEQLIKGLPQKTIFDNLYEHGYSFSIYYQSPPAVLFYRNIRKLKYSGNFHPYALQFKNDCKNGKLANYVVIEQQYMDSKLIAATDDHPSHDVADGQNYLKEVYEALRSSPQWNEMLFIITYDEHGGFYDHVPTPVTGVPSPDNIEGSAPPYTFQFDRLGVRVPAIFISPWIEKGTVLHEPSGPYSTSQFEHSSIPATVKKLFNLPDFLTQRDEWAGTFETLLTLTTPRTDCPETMPDAVKMRKTGPNEDAKLNDFQEILVQMSAALNGDHRKDIYPHKLVENMTVGEAIKYCDDALKKFFKACEDAIKNGADGDEIVDL